MSSINNVGEAHPGLNPQVCNHSNYRHPETSPEINIPQSSGTLPLQRGEIKEKINLLINSMETSLAIE